MTHDARVRLCHCGKRILFDDVNLRTLHEAPICSWWEEQCKAFGGTREPDALVVVDEVRP